MATAASGLNPGVTIELVIERTTVNAAWAIRRNELGNLDEENIADIAALKLERGRFAFLDSGRGKYVGDKELRAAPVVRAGQIVWDAEGTAAEEWSNVGPYGTSSEQNGAKEGQAA